MVDRAVVAAKVAATRDAVDRIRRVLPPDASTLFASKELGDLLDFCALVNRAAGD